MDPVLVKQPIVRLVMLVPAPLVQMLITAMLLFLIALVKETVVIMMGVIVINARGLVMAQVIATLLMIVPEYLVSRITHGLKIYS